MNLLGRHAKRIATEVLGWLLVVGGVAALVLPGPGLLLLFAGLALLATHYEWAERRLEPVRRGALKTAAESVKSGLSIALSALFSLLLIGLGILWIIQPAVPRWWPVNDAWWLVGGWGAGITLICSGVLALAMLGYSYMHFRPKKQA